MKRTGPRKAARDRPYHSPVRTQQAQETRRRVEDAARALLIERGFDAMTMGAIAKRAGVSAPTVYAAFGSKLGIVRALLDRARFGPGYQELLRGARGEPDPRARLTYSARIARQVYDGERAELDLFAAASALSADLAEDEKAHQGGRYEAQAPLVKMLAEAGHLRLDERKARDVLWTLTSRDVYRSLVVERGWSSAEYQEWLSQQIEAALLTPAPRRGSASPRRRR